MKWLVLVLATGALYFSVTTPVAAQDVQTLTVTADVGLNFRTGPSLEHQIKGLMPYGTVVQATGQTSGDWMEVRFNYQTGWAHGNWLTTSQVSQDLTQTESNQSLSHQGGESIADIIYDAAARHGTSGDWLFSVAQCESNLNPNALGQNGEVGLFQFMPSTYYSFGGTGDIWNPYNQADLAASMFAQGLSYHWTCA